VIGFTFVGLQKDFLPNPDKVRLLLEERSWIRSVYSTGIGI
jgi:hypothetical protein